MGKRARIAKVEDTGVVRSIHIQWADPVFVGKILNSHFSTEEDVDMLLNYGHLASLSKIEGKPQDYDSEYTSSNFGKIVVKESDDIWPIADGFIRIRCFHREIPADYNKNFFEFDSVGYDAERYFLYCDNKWWISIKDIGRLIPVSNLLELLYLESPNLRYSENVES